MLFGKKKRDKKTEAEKLFALAGAKSGDLTCKLILKNYFNETV